MLPIRNESLYLATTYMLIANVYRPSTQGILNAAPCILDLSLDLRGRRVV